MASPKDLKYLDCSIANSMEVIGDRWNILILRDAFMGVRRFEDFHKDLGIARNILSDRLDRLVGADVLKQVRYQDNPPRDEYKLTAKGKDLMDVLLAFWRWGDQWNPVADSRQLVHIDCGEVTHMVPKCAHCDSELTRRNLRIQPGLEVVEQRLANAASTG